jgi:valyl-tRNA synthetase
VIEPLISLQWFCRMEELAAPAIEAIEADRVRVVPADPWKRVLLDWMRALRPWCISRQLWWGHRLPVWYCDKCEETYVAESPPDRCGACDDELRQEEDVLDTWFSSQLWPFGVMGWPDDTPELRAFYPTDFLATAREILYLWVARMVMMGLEFTGEVPFEDVYVHSVILAPDGRRMSKSLGTGIDPLEAVAEQGADALRFGLMAMSSSQDVKYSHDRVEQGRDLANKMWNASRLVLLNTDEVAAGAEPETVEDRWILSRLQRAIGDVTRLIETYDFAHAALGLYSFFWNEFCDWYLEMVKERLFEAEDKAALSATMRYVLAEMLALAHPVMPFVTEEIYSFMSEGGEHLAVHRFAQVDQTLIDEEAERDIDAVIAATRKLRYYRDILEIPPSTLVSARLIPQDADARGPYERSRATIQRLARVEYEVTTGAPDSGLVLAIPGATVELLPSEAIDPEEARGKIGAYVERLRAELERARGKLENAGFVENAPGEVVQQERDKIARFERELAEIDR